MDETIEDSVNVDAEDDVKLEEHHENDESGGEETDDNEENIAVVEEEEDESNPSNTLILAQQDGGQICILLSDEMMENPDNLSNFLSSLNNSQTGTKQNASVVNSDTASCPQEDSKKPKSTTIMSNLATNIARNSLVHEPSKLNMLNSSDNADDEETEERAKQQQQQSDEKRIQEISEKPMNLPYDSESLRSMIERSRNELLLSEEMALLASEDEEPHLELVQPARPMPRPRGRPRKQILPPGSASTSTSQNKSRAQELLDIDFDPPSESAHSIHSLTRRGRKRKIKQFPDSVVDADLQHIIGVKSEKHDRENDYRHFPYDDEFEENNQYNDDDAEYLATRSELEFDPDDDEIDDDVPIAAEEIIEDSHLVGGPRSSYHNRQFTYLTRPLPKKRGRKSKAELAAMAATAALQRQRANNQYLFLNNQGEVSHHNLSPDSLMFDYNLTGASNNSVNTTVNHHHHHQQQQQQQQQHTITKQILFEELSKKIMLKKNIGEDSLLKSNSIDSLDDDELTNHTSVERGGGLGANLTTDMDQSSYNYEDDCPDDEDEQNLKSDEIQNLYKNSEMNNEKIEQIRKAEHNKVERRRRDRINNYIYELHKILPPKERLYNSKSKGAILRSVYEHYKKQCDSFKLLKEKYKVIANQNRMKDLKIRELVKEKEHLYEQLTFINQSVSSTILGFQPGVNNVSSNGAKTHEHNSLGVSITQQQQPPPPIYHSEYKTVSVPITTSNSNNGMASYRINTSSAAGQTPIKVVNINNSSNKLRLLSDNPSTNSSASNNPIYRRFVKRESYD